MSAHPAPSPPSTGTGSRVAQWRNCDVVPFIGTLCSFYSKIMSTVFIYRNISNRYIYVNVKISKDCRISVLIATDEIILYTQSANTKIHGKKVRQSADCARDTWHVTHDSDTNVTGWTVSGLAGPSQFRFRSQRALSHYRDNRPCFHRGDRLADRCVFLHIDRAIDWSVPNGWFVGPVHHVYLDLNCSRQHSVASVLSYSFQAVALSLG